MLPFWGANMRTDQQLEFKGVEFLVTNRSLIIQERGCDAGTCYKI